MAMVRISRTGGLRWRESPGNPSGAVFARETIDDLERCLLRPGNVHGAEDWWLVLEPLVARYRDRPLRRYFRVATAFARPGGPRVPGSRRPCLRDPLADLRDFAGADRDYCKTPVSTLIGGGT